MAQVIPVHFVNGTFVIYKNCEFNIRKMSWRKSHLLKKNKNTQEYSPPNLSQLSHIVFFVIWKKMYIIPLLRYDEVFFTSPYTIFVFWYSERSFYLARQQQVFRLNTK